MYHSSILLLYFSNSKTSAGNFFTPSPFRALNKIEPYSEEHTRTHAQTHVHYKPLSLSHTHTHTHTTLTIACARFFLIEKERATDLGKCEMLQRDAAGAIGFVRPHCILRGNWLLSTFSNQLGMVSTWFVRMCACVCVRVCERVLRILTFACARSSQHNLCAFQCIQDLRRRRMGYEFLPISLSLSHTHTHICSSSHSCAFIPTRSLHPCWYGNN